MIIFRYISISEHGTQHTSVHTYNSWTCLLTVNLVFVVNHCDNNLTPSRCPLDVLVTGAAPLGAGPHLGRCLGHGVECGEGGDGGEAGRGRGSHRGVERGVLEHRDLVLARSGGNIIKRDARHVPG